MERVQAIFVSHEHTDHIRGLSTLANRYYLPVYITEKTSKGANIRLIRHLSKPFYSDHTIQVGSLSVTPFFKNHDAADAHSFVVSGDGIHIGVFTDIGQVCTKFQHYFSQCHAAFLESNYDVQMLEQGRYPIHLKNRIRGGMGHLSNHQAFDLALNHRAPHLSHLILAHLSKENNHPDIAQETFAPLTPHIEISVASRYAPSAIISIEGTPVHLNPCSDGRPIQTVLF